MKAPIARFDTGDSHLVAAFQARHLKGGLKARAGWRWAGYLHGILIFKRREGGNAATITNPKTVYGCQRHNWRGGPGVLSDQ
jgi:hypothetical protein